MSNREIIIFCVVLTALLVAGFVFLGMVDHLGQQFLKVALNLNLDAKDIYVSK